MMKIEEFQYNKSIYMKFYCKQLFFWHLNFFFSKKLRLKLENMNIIIFLHEVCLNETLIRWLKMDENHEWNKFLLNPITRTTNRLFSLKFTYNNNKV